MRAIILAAGLGRRLGAATVERPKCLLDVGGQTLIQRSLDNLAVCGIEETIIVTGHQAEQLRMAVGPVHRGMPVRYLHNPDFNSTGSVLSLAVGVAQLTDPSVIVLECDLLYHPAFVEAAMRGSGDALLVADVTGSGDEVFVCADGDRQLTYLGKNAPDHRRQQSLGEFAGISRFSRELLDDYRGAAKILKTNGAAGGHYEDLVLDLARAGARVGTHCCSGVPWTEVDTEADLRRARAETLPRLTRRMTLDAEHPVAP